MRHDLLADDVVTDLLGMSALAAVVVLVWLCAWGAAGVTPVRVAAWGLLAGLATAALGVVLLLVQPSGTGFGDLGVAGVLLTNGALAGVVSTVLLVASGVVAAVRREADTSEG